MGQDGHVTLHRWSILAVWLITLVLSVLAVLFGGSIGFGTSLLLVLAAAVILAFASQMALTEVAGITRRLVVTVSGSLVIVSLACVWILTLFLSSRLSG